MFVIENRCYGNCNNPQCTAPGLSNQNNNNNNKQVANAQIQLIKNIDQDNNCNNINKTNNNNSNNDSNNNSRNNNNQNSISNANISGSNRSSNRRSASCNHFFTILETEKEYEESSFSFHTRDFKINNRNKEYISNKYQQNETNEDMKKWLLFNTASTTHLNTNKNLVDNIRTSTSNQGVIIKNLNHEDE